ncbi:MAG: hypothetical protein ACXV9T_11235 [Methylobacter sp.]
MTIIYIPADERWFATGITLMEKRAINLPHKGVKKHGKFSSFTIKERQSLPAVNYYSYCF